MNASEKAIDWSEQGLVPDVVLRHGVRRLLKQRLEEIRANDIEVAAFRTEQFIDEMNRAPIALVPQKANQQHYEVPADFFAKVLGSRRKYSCCYFPTQSTSLDEAETEALRMTCERAELRDGMEILELGCGWGSLTLWMALHFPSARIVAVSNSHSQRDFIVNEAMRRGLFNVQVITQDMNHFSTGERFDRVVSVEMFEHMRNYRELFGRIHGWLKPGGRFFMHIFAHRCTPYEFTENGPRDWMSRYFFSGGMMPSDGLPLRFQEHLRAVRQWRWDGRHYEKTANAWLVQMDTQREQIMPVMARTYGPDAAAQWFMRWRLFFIACAELFGFNDGQEWWVSHYLFERRDDA